MQRYIIILFVLVAPALFASESARSTYGAGSAVDFGAAIIPEQTGVHVRIDLALYDSDLSATVLNGVGEVDAELSGTILTLRFIWSTGLEVFGARHAAYLSVPFADAETRADITTRLPGRDPVTETLEGDRAGLADLYVTPFALAWKVGDWRIKWLETLTVPSGTYDLEENLNISRNHFALLSGLATTYRKGTEGFELNLRTGYIINFENTRTDYESGDEVIADGSVAWRFSPAFTLGLTGYACEQVTADSGEGAIYGDFKGRIYAAGPVMRYIFDSVGRRYVFIAKWLHEFEAVNRFEGDLFSVSIVTSL